MNDYMMNMGIKDYTYSSSCSWIKKLKIGESDTVNKRVGSPKSGHESNERKINFTASG